MAKYVVKENNEVLHGADKEKKVKAKSYKAGEVIELSDEHAAAIAHAIEPVKEAKK